MVFGLIILTVFTSEIQTSSLVSLSKATIAPQKNNHQNISLLLDKLLRGYDNSVRPDFGGPPTVVEVDIMVRSMGPISEIDMTYSMDCYFRQSWTDKRLSFLSTNNYTLALSISMLAKIWKPDTYFYNGKQSYLHTISTPNKFVRLHHDGSVLYSSRLTIKAGCPMNLEDFPMDVQKCPLRFGSCKLKSNQLISCFHLLMIISVGYTNNDLIYKWNNARQVAIADDMKLSQFDLIATPAGNNTINIFNSNAKSEYSMLLVSFHLQRHMGNFLIQVYGPCVLLVVLSWVSFWLNREATADRVSLGITTVLTMTFLGLEARTNLPKVPYPTALDFFVFLSFSFIFATIIQFAVVHYFTKYGSGECYFSFNSDSSSDEEDWSQLQPKVSNSVAKTVDKCSKPNPRFEEIIQLSDVIVSPTSKSFTKSSSQKISFSCNKSGTVQEATTSKRRSSIACRKASIQNNSIFERKKNSPRFNSVSKIDRVSRILFPLLFVTINVFYWYSYLSKSNKSV
ncbi:gamma-aminobutyric acid receptor alpha-like isoform X1 [Diorhabda sublineata]|uniref:gamma-aminobutyric acid receptor alpha-like isoform X1 n=1 Tax=Diorhabda sublineata TaxID=1163346 RepID=UPI0024E175AA|nr:gamma-aminobutyric acid receptor alpha-like isoform X1 [Diorhabda sublineata]